MKKATELPEHWTVEEGHVIIPAFESGGVQYWHFADHFNMYAMRAMAAIDIYEQFQMRCTREFLMAWGTAFENVLNGTQIKTSDLFDLWSKLKERLNFALPPEEMIWKLASVLYFDRNESPYTYDPVYCDMKIKRWKEAGDIESFFFASPLKDLIPLPDSSEIDLKSYLRIVDKLDGLTFSKVSMLISSDQQKADFYQAYISQRNMQPMSSD